MTVFTHPGQPEMQAEVILASKAELHSVPPVVTMRLRYPRFIHSEIMTHRVFSRNARSSRAVPVSRMIDEVLNTPVVPWHWGKNQKGMQAGEECNATLRIPIYRTSCVEEGVFDYDEDEFENHEAWLRARDHALEIAEAFTDAGYHKQICNRLLEPFMWIDTLITSTDWENFLWLRDHKDAEPHLQDLARLVDEALGSAQYQAICPGDWHLPYVSQEEITDSLAPWVWKNPETDVFDDRLLTSYALKISAARCARISYRPFDGDPSYERELERYDSLVSSDRVHASPLEHQATPDIPMKSAFDGERMWVQGAASGNLHPGWVQYRKLVPGEYYAG